MRESLRNATATAAREPPLDFKMQRGVPPGERPFRRKGSDETNLFGHEAIFEGQRRRLETILAQVRQRDQTMEVRSC